MKLNSNPARGFAIAILAVALGGNAKPAQTEPQTTPAPEHSPGHCAGKRQTLLGVGNFGEVTPMLYRGGQPNQVGLEGLAKMGVNIVVDGRLTGRDQERKEVNRMGMQFVELPWHCLFPKDETFVRFLAVLRDHPGKKVFVHCRYGDDRTGMMIAAYRMAVEGWTAEEARQEMEQFGFHHLVCPTLGRYENKFPERLKKNPGLQGLHVQPEASHSEVLAQSNRPCG
jgi:tyrosine-protein phosphatase SIW14